IYLFLCYPSYVFTFPATSSHPVLHSFPTRRSSDLFLCNRDVPTPCVSFETVRRKAMGAINFTASHNPPEYNGLKFSTERRAGARSEEHTSELQSHLNLVCRLLLEKKKKHSQRTSTQ